LSLVAYFYKRLNKIGKVNAKNILKLYSLILIEQQAVKEDIQKQQALINSSHSMEANVLNSIKLEDLKYSALTYETSEFSNLHLYLALILRTKYQEITNKISKSITHEDEAFIHLISNLDTLYGSNVIQILNEIMQQRINLALPYRKAFEWYEEINEVSYGNKRQ